MKTKEADRVDAALVAVARTAQEMDLCYGAGGKSDSVKIFREDWESLQEALAEWKAATRDFLAAQAKGSGT